MLFQDFLHPDGFFIRKINRKSDWESEDGDIDGIVPKIFEFSESDKYSLYWAIDTPTLEAVLGGLVLNRAHLQNIDLLLFTLAELDEIGIEIIDSPGDTPCGLANHLHVDIRCDRNQLRELCILAKSKQRGSSRISKKKVLTELKKNLLNDLCSTEECVRCKIEFPEIPRQ